MRDDARELADRFWAGDISVAGGRQSATLLEVADKAALILSFGNVVAFDTGDGLVLVDTGGAVASAVIDALRAWSSSPVHTAVYTHGHLDHVLGAGLFDAEADSAGRARPTIVAHEALVPRLQRYALTAGYNETINRRQFRVPDMRWPTEYRYPDVTYRDELTLTVGATRFELRHGMGETDDCTWVWVPGERILCTGDMFIWTCPNAGNPQKVQRYPREWSIALKTMASLGAELLLPGHGPPIVGAERIHRALSETAEYLDAVVDGTLALMNKGAPLDEIVRSVQPPQHLIERPYLRPVYDDPEFIVRNVWRQYAGWWDGNPANLKPASDADLAAEIASLAGGADRLAARALQLSDSGESRLAGHLAELAALAAPEDGTVHAARATVFERRAGEETSMMARSIFSWAAESSRDRAR